MPANASIYIPQTHVDLTQVFPNAKSNKSLFKKATQFEVPIGGENVLFNVMDPSNIEEHLNGFCGYIASLDDEEQRKTDATSKILQTKTVLGLKAKSEFVDNNDIWQSLGKIAVQFDGLVFVHNSVMLPNGVAIVGPLAGSGA